METVKPDGFTFSQSLGRIPSEMLKERMLFVISLLGNVVVSAEMFASILEALAGFEFPLDRNCGIKWYRKLVYTLKLTSENEGQGRRDHEVHGVMKEAEVLEERVPVRPRRTGKKLPNGKPEVVKVEDYKYNYGYRKFYFMKMLFKLEAWMDFNSSDVTKTIRSRTHCFKLTMYWMRHAPGFQALADAFNVPRSTAHATVVRYVIYIRVCFNTIPTHTSWSTQPSGMATAASGAVRKVIGFLDSTKCDRDRVNPVAEKTFRGDHVYPFLGVQLVSGADKQILDAAVAWGHNNDINVYHLSGLKEKLEKEDLAVLGDLGYEQSDNLICPESGARKSRHRSKYNVEQSFLRSQVEHDNSMAKNFKIFRVRVKVRPSIHAAAMIGECNLWNFHRRLKLKNMKKNPKKYQQRHMNRFESDHANLKDYKNGPKVVRGKAVNKN